MTTLFTPNSIPLLEAPWLPEAFTIRHATAEDTPAIKAMVFEVVIGCGLATYVQAPTDNDFENIQAAYRGPRDVFYVIEDNASGQLLGCGGLVERPGNQVEIRKMYFRHALRGQGIGYGLLNHLVSLARQWGYSLAYLETHEMLTDAQRLYARYGFTPEVNPGSTCGCGLKYVLRLSP